MKKVLFITARKYPDDTAMSVRYHNLAKLFQLCDWQVTILSRGKSTDYKISDYDGVSYISVCGKSNNIFCKFFEYKFGLLTYLKRLINENIYQAILLTSADSSVLKYLTKMNKKKMILLHDCVEWYSPEQFHFGKFAYDYRKKEYWMKLGITRDFRIIAISSYLENYFRYRGNRVERIPVIMDVESMDSTKRTDFSKTTIVYAGTPGKKDFIGEIISGISLLNAEELKRLEFRLIGIGEQQLTEICGTEKDKILKLGKSLKCMGRLKRSDVLNHLQEADFTILLRPENIRYAKAGFPTKVVESLASATPVICNLTSDLSRYITDGVNGIVIKGCTADAVYSALKRALKLSESEKKCMYINARKSAEESFDYRNYRNELERLLAHDYEDQ